MIADTVRGRYKSLNREFLDRESPAPDLDGKLIQIEDTMYTLNTAEPEEIEEAEHSSHNSSHKNDSNGHGK